MKFSQIPYKRPDIAQVTARGAAIAQAVKDAVSADEVMAGYENYKKLYKEISVPVVVSYIRHSLNVKDEFYSKENDFFDENRPLLEKIQIDFYREMTKSKFRPELASKLGEFWFVSADLALKGFDERVIEEMQQENALATRYDKLLASASLDFGGKKNNLSQLRAYQLSPDRDIRKAAYAKRTEFFVENEAEFDEIYDKLVKLRHKKANKLGFEKYTQLGYILMHRSSYGEAEVKRFRENVKSILVPFLKQVHENRRRDLGIDKLKFYDEDIYFANGNPAPKGTPEEMFKAGEKMYEELSAETKEFFEFMLDKELFDVLAREGKQGGGYCYAIPDYGYPFVFANFNGTSEDVDVLTHECGHAFNSYMAKDFEIPEYQHCTSDLAEIHSMSMEFFTDDWMELFFKEDTDNFLYMQLVSALAFIPYGCMVDEFQHIVYDNPDMSPAQRKAAWKKLEGEYKPHLDYDGDPFFGSGGAWVRQSHIYTSPFYYIDYCLAQTCALQYRIRMESDKEKAWESYVKLVKRAGSESFLEIVSSAGLKSPFDESCLKEIVSTVENMLKK